MTETSLKQRYMVITSLWEAGTRDADTLHDLTSIPLSTVYKYNGVQKKWHKRISF